MTPLLEGEVAASVARNSLWLLTHPVGECDPLALRVAVWNLLRRDGWVTDTNDIRREIRSEMHAVLGRDRLRDLKCYLRLQGNSQVWLSDLWDGPGRSRHRERTAHFRRQPLHYLLLLAFVGREARELFDLAAAFRSGTAEGALMPPETTEWFDRSELLLASGSRVHGE